MYSSSLRYLPLHALGGEGGLEERANDYHSQFVPAHGGSSRVPQQCSADINVKDTDDTTNTFFNTCMGGSLCFILFLFLILLILYATPYYNSYDNNNNMNNYHRRRVPGYPCYGCLD
jgi:hypothetical protein